jgi:aminoglycoside 3-N-acetyltransferase
MVNSQLTQDLRSLGLKRGNQVLVHSSLRSLGNFPNKAQVLFEALLEVLGREGTLLVPTLSYKTVTREQPKFDLAKTPSCVGGFTEFFRNTPGVLRSVHPTHSVGAYGHNAKILVDSHRNDITPVGPNSPFRLLRELKGFILFIGCGLKPNTSMHGVEELSQPPYLFGPETEYELKLDKGVTIQKKYITHGFEGYEQRYDRVWDLLDNQEKSKGRILNAEALLISTVPMWEKANAILKKEPFYFVDKGVSISA